MTVSQVLFTILFASIPIVIWGYVFSYYDGITFQIHKFLFWGIAGAVSIVPIIYAAQIYEYFSFSGFLTVLTRAQNTFAEFGIAFIGSYWVPVGFFLSFLLMYSFSNLSRLKNIFFQILGILFWSSVILAGIGYVIPAFGTGKLDIQGNVFLTMGSIVVVYLFVALLEESMKHLSLYGSISAELDRKDILLFAVYSALGFVFLENIIYLSHIGEDSGFGGTFFSTLFSRSIVSLLLHIFASLILALGFVKYSKLMGFPAVFAFVQWLFGAIFVHAIFNISLTYGKSGIILIYIFIGYFFFTKIFLDERSTGKIA